MILFLIKMLFGLGTVIDGLIYLVTLTIFKTTIALYFAKIISKIRYNRKNNFGGL